MILCIISEFILINHLFSAVKNFGTKIGYVKNQVAGKQQIIFQGKRTRRKQMLETIIVILVVLWLIGVVGFSGTVGNLIHLLLVIALVVFIIRLLTGRRAV